MEGPDTPLSDLRPKYLDKDGHPYQPYHQQQKHHKAIVYKSLDNIDIPRKSIPWNLIYPLFNKITLNYLEKAVHENAVDKNGNMDLQIAHGIAKQVTLRGQMGFARDVVHGAQWSVAALVLNVGMMLGARKLLKHENIRHNVQLVVAAASVANLIELIRVPFKFMAGLKGAKDAGVANVLAQRAAIEREEKGDFSFRELQTPKGIQHHASYDLPDLNAGGFVGRMEHLTPSSYTEQENRDRNLPLSR